MDPTEVRSLGRSGEMRELQTSDGSSCAPKVISSLRQLQSVTEGGFTGRKRRKSCVPPQKVVSGSCDNTGTWTVGNNGAAGTDTKSSIWDISTVAGGNRLFLPCVMSRKMHNLDAPERCNVIVKGGTKEGSILPLSAFGNEVTEETFVLLVRNAACRRRVPGVFREVALDNETEKEKRQCFSVDEAPTRAPSQKSIAEREALSSRSCAAENLHNIPRTSSHVVRSCEVLVPEATRADKAPTVEITDGRNTHETPGIETNPSRVGEEGAGVKEEVLCNASIEAAQHLEVGEANDRSGEKHCQAVREHALLGRSSPSSDAENPELNNSWNRSGTEGDRSRGIKRSLDELTEEEVHHRETEYQTSARNCGRQTRDALEGGASGYQVRTATASQLYSSAREEPMGNERRPERHSCTADELHSSDACNGDSQITVAQPHPNDQPQPPEDASRAKTGPVFTAVNCPPVPVSSLLGNYSVRNHASYCLCSEKGTSSPGPEPDATRGCRRKTRPEEQDVSTIGRSSPTGDPPRAQGAVQADEGTTENQAAGLKKKVPAHPFKTTVEQERNSATDSDDNEEGPQKGEARTIVPALSPSGTQDDAPPFLLIVDPRNANAAGGSSLQSPSQNTSRPGIVTQTHTTMSVYYHVQEGNPLHRKRFPMHNPRENVQHANRLYPVVKGVSRDNTKRRWAVYWKGSRRYFYDKLNENCYHAYQQAVNFRKCSHVHNTPQCKRLVAGDPPNYGSVKASPGGFANPTFNICTATKTDLTNNHRREAGTLAENIQSGTPLRCKRGAAAQLLSQGSFALVRHAPDLASRSNHIQQQDQIATKANCEPLLERPSKCPPKERLQTEGGEAGIPPRCSLSRGEVSADAVLDMYKTALLLVLQDLKASLTNYPTCSAFIECSSTTNYSAKRSNDCEANEQSSRCAPPAPLPNSVSSHNHIAQPTQTRNRDLRLRHFLLLIVQWHLDDVRLASQRRELQPLLGVFSPCFQHLLLPRQAPQPLQQKIYKDLIELHNAQALSHLTSA